ncbi:hypothetical protein GWI33_017514 [Rhynchophorus ferrugineus]|uniref:Uncharacterized protein n=1 Tax=Rhynchophorus ferrugineus TaxID=354439 RepID=A0A834HYD3_RHYFE|nr:hypothetical protein GWI33_017514 [Rhynchophorus ferrugineus]
MRFDSRSTEKKLNEPEMPKKKTRPAVMCEPYPSLSGCHAVSFFAEVRNLDFFGVYGRRYDQAAEGFEMVLVIFWSARTQQEPYLLRPRLIPPKGRSLLSADSRS